METISQRLLDIGDNLIVAFPVKETEVEGTKVTTSILYFFKVAACWPFYYEWNRISAIPAGTGLDFNYLGTTGHGSGDDILRIERDDFHVYHFGMSPDQPYVRIYRTISPVGTALSALDRKAVTDMASPIAGSNFDYYTGKQIPDKFDPPSFTENLVFRAGSDDAGKYFQFGFYAEQSVSAGMPFYLIGKGYKLIPVVKREKKEEILEEATLQRRFQKVKTITVTIGGIWTSYSLAKFVPDSWDRVGNYLEYEPEV